MLNTQALALYVLSKLMLEYLPNFLYNIAHAKL